MLSNELSKNQINYRRSFGVQRAWERERELVKQGRGTREWTVAEQKSILKTGRVNGYQGHHMKSVSKHPEYADDPKNIQFLDARKGNNEHLKAHKGSYRNASEGRYNIRTEKVRGMGDGKPRAMNSYELKDKAIEKRGYTKYAKNSGQQTAKTKTTYNGETYNRTMVKSGGSKSQSEAKPQAVPERYGAKMAGKSADERSKASSGNYASKASLGTKGGTEKSASAYGSKMSSGENGKSSAALQSHGSSSQSR